MIYYFYDFARFLLSLFFLFRIWLYFVFALRCYAVQAMEYSDDDSEFSVDPDLRADDGSDVDYTDSDEEDRFRALEADVDAMYEVKTSLCN